MKKKWLQHYQGVPKRLAALSALNGVASVFNANIDAVLKLTPEKVIEILDSTDLVPSDIESAARGTIGNVEQLFKGFFDCFSRGAAQEWLVTDHKAYLWMQKNLGFDHLQMGGQGGIIANVMAVGGATKVYVHCASMPGKQSALFLDRDNLLTANPNGSLLKAVEANRDEAPLIHWILEFDKGAVIEWKGKRWQCPKSNRFIATYDPLNFKLHIDKGFDKAMANAANPLDLVLLSGYQMLGEEYLHRIDESWQSISAWKKSHPGAIIHFEFASTQDTVIRKALAENLAPKVDSVGLNEQELVGALEVTGQTGLAKRCEADLHSVSLFEGLLALHENFRCPRIQLHMFGLYVTLLAPDSTLSLEDQLAGMALAATVAAAKAGTGSIEKEENLLWAQGREVADIALKELTDLSVHLEKEYGLFGLLENGIGSCDRFKIAALPTILIEKPVTLVGMGDTISSLSLAGSMVKV